MLCLGVAACGGGGSSETAGPQQIQLVGSVGDGPVIDATITVTDNNGDIIATSLSDATASYNINIPDNSLFPVIITATGGTDIVTGDRPDFTMISTIVDKQNLAAQQLVANVNPFSTFMVKMSRAMQGGLSRNNLDTAKQILLQKFNFGFDADTFPDPISSQITILNVASVVKSSEAMGEMIRRTRDTIISSGSLLNGDDIINALSNDIADGKIDGVGVNANARITATAKITSAQVLIEVLGNRLKVKNSDSTALMDNAIKTTQPDASMTTDNVMITTDLINQTRDLIAAAARYHSSTELSTIETIISTLNGNIFPSDIKTVLPTNAENALNSAIISVALATEQEIGNINKGTNTDIPAQVAPVINTVAIGTAQEGIAYRYDVNATDANSDDILNYALITAPEAMSINASTGLITWTPSSTQTGTHSVSVQVSDNASPNLSTTQSFTIQVAAAPVINVAPTISSAAITTAQVDTSYNYDVNATDTNSGDTLSYSLTTAPAGMLINSSNGMITWTPASTQSGAQNVTVRVSDNASPALFVTQSFSIQVTPTPVINVAPVITTSAVTSAQVDVAYNYNVNASDNNINDTLTYSLTSSPLGMSIDTSSGFILWTPSSSQLGAHDIAVVVNDNASPALSSTQVFTIQVTTAPVVNVRPVITSSPVILAEVNKAYRYDVNATDDNSGDVLSYTLTRAPVGMVIDTATGLITWTPSNTQTGAHRVSVRVDDNVSPAMSTLQDFSISVAGPIIRVNAGGEDYVDSKGHLWAADYGFNLGEANTRNNEILDTVEDTLFKSERWHSTWQDSTSAELEYNFSVPNGDYAVRLLFAETCATCATIFDAEIEGTLLIDDLNLSSEPGVNTALIKSFVVTVNDGEINIRFPRNKRSPKISAIEILPVTTQTNVATSNNNSVEIQTPEFNSGSGSLSIYGEPENGSAVISSNNITYTPDTNFSGQDTIIYSFIDSNGAVIISSITITVTCGSCTREPIVSLGWQPTSGSISGYRIYYGPDGATATELISDVTVNSGLIDPTAPKLDYAATTDLNFYPGEQVCFKVQAYLNNQSSPLSDAICGTI